jgi:hypothetical protein
MSFHYKGTNWDLRSFSDCSLVQIHLLQIRKKRQLQANWIRYYHKKNNKKIFPPLIDDGSSESSGGTFRARRRNGGGTRE